MELLQNELNRYKRQLMIDGWGEAGQIKLKQSTVFVAGAGGLGSPAAIYLAAAGIGAIRICDYDVVEMSNLNRQILHDHSKIGVEKVASARQTLERINNNVHIIPIIKKIDEENVDELIGDADIIIDCMDNFPTRYVLMQSAFRKKIPLVHGSIWGMEGRLAFIQSPETPCLKCIFPEAPPKEIFPVIGATAGVIGAFQALEALKYLTGMESNLTGNLLVWDGWNIDFRKFKIYKDPKCTICGKS